MLVGCRVRGRATCHVSWKYSNRTSEGGEQRETAPVRGGSPAARIAHGLLEGAPHKRGKIVLPADGWASCGSTVMDFCDGGEDLGEYTSVARQLTAVSVVGRSQQ